MCVMTIRTAKAMAECMHVAVVEAANEHLTAAMAVAVLF